MPESETRDQEPPASPNADEANIPDEDAFEASETAREAREEAEKLDAIPYERLKKEDPDAVNE